MVNKDMNGFPVKKCSAFQFFKKRVRRWIKSPMVSVDKHQSPSLKYTGPPVVTSPPAEADLEPSLCQTCLGDHAFQRAVLPQEKESCSWETQSGCEVKDPSNHANILTKPDPRTFWTNDDSGNCDLEPTQPDSTLCVLPHFSLEMFSITSQSNTDSAFIMPFYSPPVMSRGIGSVSYLVLLDTPHLHVIIILLEV